MTDNPEKNINELFSALPENVRKWLSSEELVFIVTEIETKLGISDEKILIIPQLILRLVVQDLEPQDFISELSDELGIEFSVAKTITEDIEKRALRPIAAELRDKLGLEVKLIYYGKSADGKTKAPAATPLVKTASVSASSEMPPTSKITPAATSAVKPVSPPAFATPPVPPSKPAAPAVPAVAKAPIPQPIRKEEPAQESATPFILHQENSPTSAPFLDKNGSAGSSRGPQGTSLPKTSLTMKVQNYFQSAATPERTASAPISVRMETPIAPASPKASAQPEQKIAAAKQPFSPAPKTDDIPLKSGISLAEQAASAAASASQAKNQPEQARVVHYSNLRTPLTNLGLPKKDVDKENIVDLRKFM